MRFNFFFDNAELFGGYGYESHAQRRAKKCEIGRWKSCCDTAASNDTIKRDAEWQSGWMANWPNGWIEGQEPKKIEIANDAVNYFQLYIPAL